MASVKKATKKATETVAGRRFLREKTGDCALCGRPAGLMFETESRRRMCMCDPCFDRVGTWMLAKSLGLRQSITDGGIYTPSAVPHYRGSKPGLDTLSRMSDWDNPRRGRTLAPLPGLDWTPGTPVPGGADRAALDHVRRFWDPYGLAFPFDLAHKAENAFHRAAYWSKADYALQTDPAAEPVYKMRGKNTRGSRRDGSRPHPTFALLDAILSGRDEFPQDLAYRRGGILKVGMYRQIQSSEGGYADLKHLRPGDSQPEKEYEAFYNNTYFPLADERTYLKRRNRKRKHRGERVEWFERYRADGVAAVHRKAAADRLTPVR